MLIQTLNSILYHSKFKMTAEEEAMGAVKIKDGLFIGDQFAAQVLTSINHRT
jgi:hypothetical protein